MITVDVDLHPRGDQRHRHPLAKLSIWNDATGDHEWGNYRYEISGIPGIPICTGAIIGHCRAQSVFVLLALVLKDADL